MLSTNYITAGKATITISNGKGEHYTYRITKKEAQGPYPQAFFVNLLTGPNNTTDYTYLGLLDTQTGNVKLTAKSKYTQDSKPTRIIRWALHHVWQNKNLPEGYTLQHQGKCGRCGRPLTHPESLETGLGPECANRV